MADSTTLNITGGGHITGNLTIYDSSIINLLGGSSVDGNVTANGSSLVTITGGAVGGNVYANDGATVSITGGSFQGDLVTHGSSTVTYSGGSFAGDLEVSDGSQLMIYGQDLSIPYGSVDDLSGFLPGTLQDGTSLGGYFPDGTPVGGVSFFLDHGSTLILLPAEPTPEPASLTLLGFGAATLLGYTWRKRKHGQTAW